MKRFKKVFCLTTACVLAMSLLAGCGGSDSNDSSDSSASIETSADATKIGFLYIGSVSDSGYTEAMHNSTKALEEHFAGDIEVIIAEHIAEDHQAVTNTAINMIDQGASIIVGGSFGYMDSLEELSAQYEDVTFLHFSGYKMNDTNFSNYFGAMEEPRYLSGMIAGMMTESNKLGYVAAFPYTEVNIGINAFTLGAQAVNPDVEVNVVYVNSWYDPANETAAAESLLAQGCDIITQHGDSVGPQLAAGQVGKYAIGYNLDNSLVSPDSFLTAPVWHHEEFLIPTIGEIIDGTYATESYYGTMEDGYVALAPMTDLVPEDVQSAVNEVMNEMMVGNFPVFVGPIQDVDGNIIVEDGEALDRDGIWTVMQSLVKGVNAIQ